MDAHSLSILEYRQVIEKLMAHTSNGIGREFASELMPLPYPETVVRRLQETREARHLRDEGGGIPLGGIKDVRETLERARIETRLSPTELLDLMHTTGAARRLRQFLLNRREECPMLGEMGTNLPVMQIVEQRINECISEGGDVRDSASPELARVRSTLKITHNRLNDRLQSLLSSDKSKYVQESVITIREGRYCIPVKAEYAKLFGGIVHDASSSGATVFIEPASTVDLGNEYKQLQLKEEQEVDRILRDLSRLVGSYYDEMQRMVSILGHLDVIHAKAVLAEEMQATEPTLNRRGIVKLRDARHPLLVPPVMPIDIELGERFTTLLITGPNTGGKTVTLKTLGLLTLMTLAGMQIPAHPDSEIALFDQIFADIGDEQDIRQSLSTFSAHLKNLVRITEAMGNNALILMDEVGSGTDPAEGAALAKALLDHFMARGARVVATTHYGELKDYAYARAGVENASVEFDKETLSPTYKVLLGVPGSSQAFYIASRIGLRDSITNDARQFLSHREIETTELLQEIEKSRKAASEALKEAERSRREANSLRDEYQRRAREIAEVQRTVRQQAQEEARLVLNKAQERADNLVKELQRMNKGARQTTGVGKKLGKLRGETYDALKEKDALPAEDLAPVEAGHVYKSGDRVRVVSWNMDGELLENPKDGVVAVQLGSMRATLPLEQLRPLKAVEVAPQRLQTSGAGEITLRKALQIAPELMLKAMRVDEAMPLLDKYLDDAYTANIGQVRIIHGKGTGALRSAVQEFLRGHPAVGSYRLGIEGEGGDGATVVTLKS